MKACESDFKYVLQDVGKVYIGAAYSYQEMMDIDEIPFKFKAVLSHYILKEVAADTTVENHIFYMKKGELSYMIYDQLKAKFKINLWRGAETGSGRKEGYESRYYTIEEICKDTVLQSKKDEAVVEELTFSKFNLMTISL